MLPTDLSHYSYKPFILLSFCKKSSGSPPSNNEKALPFLNQPLGVTAEQLWQHFNMVDVHVDLLALKACTFFLLASLSLSSQEIP